MNGTDLMSAPPLLRVSQPVCFSFFNPVHPAQLAPPICGVAGRDAPGFFLLTQKVQASARCRRYAEHGFPEAVEAVAWAQMMDEPGDVELITVEPGAVWFMFAWEAPGAIRLAVAHSGMTADHWAIAARILDFQAAHDIAQEMRGGAPHQGHIIVPR